mgnify:CR=1 FL=1
MISELREAIKNRNTELLKKLKKTYDISFDFEKKIISVNNKEEIKKNYEYWDLQQYIRKILLNSLYGSILNEHCLFFDKRIGQSVTLSGRMIIKFMGEKINELITGEYNYMGDAIIYGDTDSIYFSLNTALKNNPLLKNDYEDFEINKENIIKFYDLIAEEINNSFPDYLKNTFSSRKDFISMKAKRELVGTKGLFITKKRYAILLYDKEGIRVDNDKKIKIMGLDLKRSDTPVFIQKFLEDILLDVLEGKDKDFIIEKILEFKKEFQKIPSWEKGIPKRVNGLTEYFEKYNAIKNLSPYEVKKIYKSITIPGHVMASINYNILKKYYGDTKSLDITDGSKIIVCKLKENEFKMNSVAFPIDLEDVPEWFKKLPFDDLDMEKTALDKKIENLLGVLNWNLLEHIVSDNYYNDFFE